jgi:NAD(P)-dependent dehydrogenase (short-subunit alcohol dehydrogenase family)
MSSNLRPGDLVVVTGSAQGIGRAIALRLAAMNVRLALWDVNPSGAEETAALCRERGAEARSSRVDVSVSEEIEAAASMLARESGPLFGLVNNAGIFPRAGILEIEPRLWEHVLRVNLMGAFHCVRALVPSMVEQGRGAVVNIASGRALQGAARGSHYAASKAGLVAFTKSLALEVATKGIRANCVIPGITETAQPLEDMTLAELHNAGRKIPLGRVGQPSDVAGVVAFLLGDDAGFITGQAIAVNGGSIMIP